jgi:hypothetical protein
LGWREAGQYIFSAQGATTIALLSVIISAILSSIFIARERHARAEVAFQSERARVEAADGTTRSAG